jgi:hypothetical protein
MMVVAENKAIGAHEAALSPESSMTVFYLDTHIYISYQSTSYELGTR